MKRYLALAEGYSADDHYGKTTYGVIRYSPDPVVVVLDSTRAGETVEGIPVVASVADALAYEPTVALVGVAVAGGRLPPVWRGILRDAIEAGLDVEAGMHEFLADDRRARRARPRARRRAPRLPAPAGRPERPDRREPDARRVPVVLTVGSDCAVGKKTVAVELDRAARERGLRSVFVPTGQTGIMIAGWGIAVDAVVSDFLAGAAERLVVEGAARGDLLFVEGQGSIIHPQFSGVTLGLYHGSAPHALVLVHRAGDTELEGVPGHPILPLPELVELYERLALPVRPARVAAIALNTGRFDDEEARATRSPRPSGRPACPPTTLSVLALTACSTPCWRRCLRV